MLQEILLALLGKTGDIIEEGYKGYLTN